MKVTLLGKAVGKPTQTHSDRWAERDCVLAYRAFCDRLRYKAYGKNQKQPLQGPTVLTVRVFVRDTTVKDRNGPHTVKPDLDNICKAVSDSLFLNDQMIYELHASKVWANGSPERIELEWDAPPGGSARE